MLLPEHGKHMAAMAEIAQNSPFWILDATMPSSFLELQRLRMNQNFDKHKMGNTGLSMPSVKSIEVCTGHSLKDLRDTFLVSHKSVALKNFHLECESLKEKNKSQNIPTQIFAEIL